MAKKKDPSRRQIAANRKARFHYEIGESFEAGIVLTGTEVKSLRAARRPSPSPMRIADDGELWLVNANIPEYCRPTASTTSRSGRGSCCCTASRSTS